MPELPEVETIVRSLRSKILGQHLLEIKKFKPETVAYRVPFVPLRIEEISRRGKYIILAGADNEVIIHLRMTGRLYEKPESQRFIRAQLVFDNTALYFEDMRRFGRIVYCRINNPDPGLKALGPEPWDTILDEIFHPALQRSKKPIKNFLLDQTKIAGIGNIYADESCFHAHISPLRFCNKITKAETKTLLNSIRYILEKAVILRGTTFAHFIDADGKRGSNYEFLKVYGRKGAKCLHCGHILKNTKVAGRTTVYCPYCQK